MEYLHHTSAIRGGRSVEPHSLNLEFIGMLLFMCAPGIRETVTRSHLPGGLSGGHNSESHLALLEEGHSPQLAQCVQRRSWLG